VDESKTLEAIVIGGSMAGLCAGLVLRAAGCAVEIFEKSPREMQERGAGLVVQDEVLNFVIDHCCAIADELGVRSRARQLLARDGSTIWTETSLQLMTSWDSLYRRLKRAFPQAHYHYGTRLAAIRQDTNRVYAGLEDGREQACDLLVCADGANSTARRLLLPDVAARYAGYVAWRGMVAERDVADWARDLLEEKFTFFHTRHTQMLSYFVPGPAGETAAGGRRVNWVWYWNVPEGEELRETLTDRSGLIHDYSVPQGAVEPALWRRQREVAVSVLPDVFQHLFAITADPFIQPIYDLSVPQMAFGRVCLLGDAAFVPRPHPAASTYKGVANAVALGHSLRAHGRDVAAALRQWEPAQMELGENLSRLGQEQGNRSQFSTTSGPGVIQSLARAMRTATPL
jgi:2-polyprenyl-6-methoxyphenol hydroxylase-like FAD-dependent oxidoreductase